MPMVLPSACHHSPCMYSCLFLSLSPPPFRVGSGPPLYILIFPSIEVITLTSTSSRGSPSHSDTHPTDLQPNQNGQPYHHGHHPEASSTNHALTYQHLTEHNRYHARTHSTAGTGYQVARDTAAMIQAGRGLGFDLSQTVHGETMRRYDGMTPTERFQAERFLAEKNRAERARTFTDGYVNGCRR